jgi:hypothetical protein
MCTNLLGVVLPNVEASKESTRYEVKHTLLLAWTTGRATGTRGTELGWINRSAWRLRAGRTLTLRASMSANLQESVHGSLVWPVDKVVLICQDVDACHFLDHVKDVWSIVTAPLGRYGGANNLLPQKVKHTKLRRTRSHLGQQVP